MKKIIMLLSNTSKKFVSFLTSKTTTSYITIGALSIVATALCSIGAIFIIVNTSSYAYSNSEHISNVTKISESETTTKENISLMTTTENVGKNENITSTLPESTTTVSIETTIEETTTQPETINTEDLDIKDDSLSDETEPIRNEVDYEPETTPETTEPQTTTKTPETTQIVEETTTSSPEESTTSSVVEDTINEYSCVVKGIDISKWNSLNKAKIDWKQVKDSGVSFVIIRAGYRSISSTSMYKDPYFEEHIEGALAAGLQVGVYFYSQAITETEALEEASYLLSIIKDYKITYPVCFDWEPASGTRVRNANLTKTEATNIAKKFLSTIKGYGYDTMLYSYHSAIKEFFYMDQLSDHKAWVAYYYSKYKNTGVQYQVGDPLPEETYPYQMWQYTSTATVPGIQGVVDMNVAFFSYSGSDVPTSAIQLHLPSDSYTTNVGTPIDYMTGVTAFNTTGLNVSNSITTLITDSNGNTIDKSDVFNTPGEYTITYTIKDFTGASKSATAALIVRGTPTIILTSDELTFNQKDLDYETILLALKNNIVEAYDYENEKLDISKIIISGLDLILDKNRQENETPSSSETSSLITGNTESETTSIDTETTNDETTSIYTKTTDDETTSVNTNITDNQITYINTETSDSTHNETSKEESTSESNNILVEDYIITYTIKDNFELEGYKNLILHIIK